MKKLSVMFVLMMGIFLTACSEKEAGIEVTTANYISEATDYITAMNEFASELPSVAEEAAANSNAKAQLEELLVDIQLTIEEFNSIEEPELLLLKVLHSKILEQNEEALEAVETYLENIEAGTLRSELIAEIKLSEDLEVYSNLLEELEKIKSEGE